MNKFLTSVPVFIDSFAQDEVNQRYTKAKLKVFYVGETVDHRLFTQDFSDKVVKTLPLTPVVAYYSEEDEDFKGHNSTQFVYGVVPEGTDIEFVKEEDGRIFAVTDVILFTERKDNIGEVAKKIIGKQHSLELDPDTLQYKINRKPDGSFANVEFIDGQFIGLSVLGDDETPAFTGSEFFSVQNEIIPNELAACEAKFNKLLNLWKNNGGSIEMFNFDTFFTQVENQLVTRFKTTMQEFQHKIYAALDQLGVYGWIEENTEEYAVVGVWDDATGTCRYTRYTINVADDVLLLNDPVEVKAYYLTEEEGQILATDYSANVPNEQAGFADDSNDDSEQDDDDNAEEGSPIEDATQIVAQPQEVEQVGTATPSASATTLTDSERAELEEYRKQAKINMVNEYRGDMPDEILDHYITLCGEISKDELEAKLAIEFRNYTKTFNKTENQQPNVFAIITNDAAGTYDPNDPASVISKYGK